MIRLFDCNAHPTLTGKWSGQHRQSPAFENFLSELKRPELIGACAVGLWGVEGYEHEAYIRRCGGQERLIPVAGFSPAQAPAIEPELKLIKRLGYAGIKIHPAGCRTDLLQHRQQLITTFSLAAELKLVVLYCTYLGGTMANFPAYDPFWALADVVKASPETRIILIHGGTTRILLYAELARSHPHLLLDLSVTLLKYRGSSVDLDLRQLCSTLDQRLCLGTDYPEYGAEDVILRAGELMAGLDQHKIDNICFRNVMKFFNIPSVG